VLGAAPHEVRWYVEHGKWIERQNPEPRTIHLRRAAVALVDAGRDADQISADLLSLIVEKLALPSPATKR
jgi:hypothetical protein